jgi:hypothetical protein
MCVSVHVNYIGTGFPRVLLQLSYVKYWYNYESSCKFLSLWDWYSLSGYCFRTFTKYTTMCSSVISDDCILGLSFHFISSVLTFSDCNCGKYPLHSWMCVSLNPSHQFPRSNWHNLYLDCFSFSCNWRHLFLNWSVLVPLCYFGNLLKPRCQNRHMGTINKAVC